MCQCACVCVSSASPSAVCPSAWAIGDHAFQSQSRSHWQPPPKQKTKNRCWFYCHGTTGGCTLLFLPLTQAPAFSHSLTLFIWGHTVNTHTHRRTKARVKNKIKQKALFFLLLSPLLAFKLARLKLHSDIMLCAAGRAHTQTHLRRRANLAMCSLTLTWVWLPQLCKLFLPSTCVYWQGTLMFALQGGNKQEGPT